jgi:hypothetical protein
MQYGTQESKYALAMLNFFIAPRNNGSNRPCNVIKSKGNFLVTENRLKKPSSILQEQQPLNFFTKITDKGILRMLECSFTE